MRQQGFGGRQAFPASETERAAIRALKNWLLSMPGQCPFTDQLVRLRISAAIAIAAEGLRGPAREAGN